MLLVGMREEGVDSSDAKRRVLPVTRRIRFSRIVASSVAHPYAERHRALGTAVAMVGSWLFVCDLD
jgi:hypothetical protein